MGIRPSVRVLYVYIHINYRFCQTTRGLHVTCFEPVVLRPFACSPPGREGGLQFEPSLTRGDAGRRGGKGCGGRVQGTLVLEKVGPSGIHWNSLVSGKLHLISVSPSPDGRGYQSEILVDSRILIYAFLLKPICTCVCVCVWVYLSQCSR